MHKSLRWIRQKIFAVLFLAAVLLLLTLTHLAVRLLPSRFYAGWLRRSITGSVAPLAFVRSLRRKIHLAAVFLPWHPACLAQALAGRFILSTQGYSSALFLGVRNDGCDLAAHAWLKSGELFVCGKSEADHYGVVAQY